MAGCSSLGIQYDNGEGVKKDKAQALVLWRRACDGSDPNGCHSLGIEYEYGGQVPADKAQAIEFYRKACDGGDSDGCKSLKKLEGK